ncbi:MAG: DUF6090 family protein [Maribacter arcticus]|uniref:DUF6090 family protein n=2 Tax=Maribacter arcticus TaxID=561365 RepID=UPI0030010328
MIKFFRRIRQQLLTENKFSKYLLYAIGEIILVVIGILIALSINNWNENRKQKLNDIKFLSNLRYEIELDTLVFADKITEYNLINENLIQTLQFLIRPTGINENERQIVIKAISDLEVLTPGYKNIERNDLKLADGTLDFIDSNLNKKYQQYIERVKSNNDIISKLGESLQFVVLQDLYPKVDLDYAGLTDNRIHFDLEKLRNDRTFKNAVNRSIQYRNISILYMNNQKAKAYELLIVLKEKLK